MNETYDVSAFRAVFERSFTWISGFLRNVRRFGEKTAVIDPASGRTWTYAALNRDANRLANALLAAGVGPGDVVLYQLYNSTQFVLSYLAPQKLGAINEPANFNLAAGETARLIDRDRVERGENADVLHAGVLRHGAAVAVHGEVFHHVHKRHVAVEIIHNGACRVRHARKEQGAEPQVPPFCLTPQSQKGVGHAAQDRDQGIVKLHSIVPFRKKCPRARRLRGVHHAVPP